MNRKKFSYSSDTVMNLLRAKILEAALPNILSDGWTRKSLVKGACSIGYAPTDVDIAFPLGVREAVMCWLSLTDACMESDARDCDLVKLRIREKVVLSVRLRLEKALPYKDVVRRTLSFMCVPGNMHIMTASLFNTVDSIWLICGDMSNDYTYYTRRILLSAVFSSTLIYWLDDNSDNHADTWAFLNRRIDDVMGASKVINKLKVFGVSLPNPRRFSRAWYAWYNTIS
ncbi:COQ9 family protein [Candidatus Endolissoclinum faulkneri L2]|uniref:COQ9 family protein n=1 Tax=Candidatus Endolissoclinum faulkneri L2 TaxID=1193729 RepID=K7Z3V2_9PROT|nr:COQ9 family protein [Candidatus Endolissoclinum faulkneri]AFX98683.1 COQ9 family protein [Candidatus Endolissoclinum faulkneri L2]